MFGWAIEAENRIFFQEKLNLIKKVLQIGREKNIKFVVYAPPGKVIFRSWDPEKYGDKTNKGTIKQCFEKGSHVTGIERVKDKIILTAAIPVKTQDREIVGALEIFGDVYDFLKKIVHTHKVEAAIFLREKNHHFNLLYSTSKFPIELLTNEILKNASQLEDLKDSFKESGSWLFGASPLIDFSGKRIGFWVLSKDVSWYQILRKKVLKNNLFIATAAVLIFSIVAGIVIKIVLAKPLDKNLLAIDKVASGELDRKSVV